MTIPLLPARSLLGAALLAGLMACNAGIASSKPITLPNPKADMPLASAPTDQVAVFAGGCFWGIEAVFEHVKGVKQSVSGYAGGDERTANYDAVSSGMSRHAEAVRVVYDPAKITYGQLLKVYFSVAHDPTQLNRQSPDVGPQYRSEIFTTSPMQKQVAQAYIAQLGAARKFHAPIVTKVSALKKFYPAETHHQDYLRKHPNQPYIVINDAPKLVHLKRMFPALYTGG